PPAGGALAGPGPRAPRRHPTRENAAELRPPFGAVRAGIEQRLLDAVEHLGGAVLGQFDLDLLPPDDAGRGSKGLAGDPVVGDRGEGAAVAVSQRPLLASSVELD